MRREWDARVADRAARRAGSNVRRWQEVQEVRAKPTIDIPLAGAFCIFVRGDGRQGHVTAKLEIELERSARALGALRVVGALVVGDAVAIVVRVEAVAAWPEHVGPEDGSRAVDVAAVDIQQRAERV